MAKKKSAKGASRPASRRGRGRPATGQMPQRFVRIGDELWARVLAAAAAAGETPAGFIRRVLDQASR